MSYPRFLCKLLVHKWWVLVYGRRLGAPLWRLIIHDWSKYLPGEHRFYYYRAVDVSINRYDHGWLHHHHVNPHHWQHWVLREDSGTTRCLDMPDHFVREMVADWAAAGMAKSGRLDLAEWYARKRGDILVSERTRGRVEELLDELVMRK